MVGLFRRIWPLGIRIQLTLWYIIVFAVLMLLFGSIFYVNLRASLTTSFDAALQVRTQQIATGIDNENGIITIQDVTGALPGLVNNNGVPLTPDGQDTLSQKKTHVDTGALVRIIRADGQIIYVAPAFLALNVPSASITQPLHGITWQGTLHARDGQPVRLYSIPLVLQGSTFAILQVGASLASLDDTLRSVLIEFLLIAPFILLFSAFGSYLLATRAFAPIKRLTRTAQSIGVGDLHQRVPVPSAKDEVQNLALTFNEMIERLDKAFTQQRRFVADASHELRTPVAAIRSMTDVVMAQRGITKALPAVHRTASQPNGRAQGPYTLSPEQRLDTTPLPPPQAPTEEEYVAVVREVNLEAERLSHLISDLLALARADEGQTLFEWEPVRLDLLTADVAATAEPLATEQDITLEIASKEPALVLGDEARLIQAILNLIHNAITYTNAGGKVILNVEVKNKSAYLIIRDTGIGIEPEHWEHIFERFYRTDPARSRAAGGSGLGLAIVDWVVRAHGGNITVESQVGQGSAFIVAIPLAECKEH